MLYSTTTSHFPSTFGKKSKNTTFFGREISTNLRPIFKISKILVTSQMIGRSKKWHPTPIPLPPYPPQGKTQGANLMTQTVYAFACLLRL